MKSKRFHLPLIIAACHCLFAILISSCLEGATKPALEDLMKENGKAFSAIEKGITKGKFEGLPEKAQGIADTGKLVSKDYEPPIHKEDTEKFKALASQLAADAQRLKQALNISDPVESKKHLKNLEANCISCHKAFVPKKKK